MGQDLFKRLRGDDMRVTLRVGELLLPDIPAGKLDARFQLQAARSTCSNSTSPPPMRSL
jgi:hypothetical protein